MPPTPPTPVVESDTAAPGRWVSEALSRLHALTRSRGGLAVYQDMATRLDSARDAVSPARPVDGLRRAGVELARRARLLDRLAEFAIDLAGAGARAEVRKRLCDFLRNELGVDPAGVTFGEFGNATFSRPAAWGNDMEHAAQRAIRAAGLADATLRRLEIAQLQSLTDPLTGLYNRRALDRMLPREVALARRHGHPLTLAVLDVDDFKAVNDTLGHAAGDRLLRMLARTLVTALRRTDLAFRTGGDEFAVLFPQTTYDAAATAATKLAMALSAGSPGDIAPRLTRLPTVSCGLAALEAESTPESLLDAADAALYAVKADR